MANIDCSSEMTGFHLDEVTLPRTEQKEMRKRRDAGRTRLETGLGLKEYAHPKESASQGSYQMRTMIQDDDCDYDIDDGVYFAKADLEDDNGNELSPVAARERVCEALKWDGRLKHEAEVKRNCVRQPYPAGYHIDVPVYRIVTTINEDDETVEHYELASEDTWAKNDARAVTRWYNDQVGDLNEGESDGSQMRRLTKLTKKLARSRSSWKAKTASGICITKLVYDHFVHQEDRDDKALRETWKAIQSALGESTEIKHPVIENSNLADQGDPEVQFFSDCLDEAIEKLDGLDASDCDRKKARAIWDDVFNTTYFSDKPDEDDKAKKSSVIITSTGTAQRNDGGGRFG